jgi:hypothetical protein
MKVILTASEKTGGAIVIIYEISEREIDRPYRYVEGYLKW